MPFLSRRMLFFVIFCTQASFAFDEGGGYRSRASSYSSEGDSRYAPPSRPFNQEAFDDDWSPPPRRGDAPAWGSQRRGDDFELDRGADNRGFSSGGSGFGRVREETGAGGASNERFGAPKGEVSFRLVPPDEYDLPLTQKDRRPSRGKSSQ